MKSSVEWAIWNLWRAVRVHVNNTNSWKMLIVYLSVTLWLGAIAFVAYTMWRCWEVCF